MVLSNRWSPEQVRNSRASRLTAPFLATPLWSQGSFVSLPRCARQSKSTSCANGKHLAGSEVRQEGVRRCAISGAYQRILAYREQGIATGNTDTFVWNMARWPVKLQACRKCCFSSQEPDSETGCRYKASFGLCKIGTGPFLNLSDLEKGEIRQVLGQK